MKTDPPTTFIPQWVDPQDLDALEALRRGGRVWEERDLLPEQLDELVEARAVGGTDAERAAVRDRILDGVAPERFGRWVYYPWSGRLLRILPREWFWRLRLDRNRDKITEAEHATLLGRRIGVVGLSVGNAIARTMAQEGIGGSFVLADLDRVETSNLNRLRAPLHALGVLKTVVAARQIAEVDPYLQVVCFHEGLSEHNLDAFFDGLDLVVEECDDLSMKLRIRQEARRRRLPVVMETTDRGTLDIERFDLEPSRPVLHGRVPEVDPDALRGLSAGQRLALVAGIVGYDVSTRAAASMLEIGSTLSTWPQLASDVALGSALVSAAVRSILLGRNVPSGRRNLDVAAVLEQAPAPAPPPQEGPVVQEPAVAPQPDVSTLQRTLVQGAIQSPSSGNAQPWAFRPLDGDALEVHVHAERATSLLDADGHAALLSVGAAIEGMVLTASAQGYTLEVQPTGQARGCVAVVTPRPGGSSDALAGWLGQRFTDRRNPERTPLEPASAERLHASVIGSAAVHLHTSPEGMAEVGEHLGHVDRVRFLHEQLHRELWSEVRWSEQDAERSPDGITLHEMAVGPGDVPILKLLSRPDVAADLRARQRGLRLGDLVQDWVASASALGLVTAPDTSPGAILQAGRSVHRLWLQATADGLGLQPIGVAPYMIRHLGTEHEQTYTEAEREVLRQAHAALERAFPDAAGRAHLFLFRLLRGGERYARTWRHAWTHVLLPRGVSEGT